MTQMHTGSTFSVGYVILAHDNFLHLDRLCRALLADERSRVFLHVDAKAGDVDVPRKVIKIKKRHKVYWGDFTIVEATCESLQVVVTAKDSVDYVVLLSGSDFPVKHVKEINDYLSLNRSRIYMDADALPSTRFSKPLALVTWNCDRPNMSRMGSYIRKKLKERNIIKHHRDHKKIFGQMVPFSGSQWWAMPLECVQYLLAWRIEHADVYQYFRNVTCPEETLFQTAILNSAFRENVSSYITYCDWSKGPPHPVEISDEHIDLFLEGDVISNNNPEHESSICLFARKFEDSSLELVARLPSYTS